MTLRTTTDLIDSLDEELVDLLSERMRLVASLDDREEKQIGPYVNHMRSLAAVYRVSPDLVEAIAVALSAEEARIRKSKKG